MKRLAATTALAVATCTLVLAGGGAASAEDRPVVLDHGHIDLFEVTYDEASSGLQLQVKDDTGIHDPGATFRDPSDVTIAVDEEKAATQVPDAPGYEFLGEVGDTFYLLPQGQDQSLPWPGWSTERLMSTLPSDTEIATTSNAVQLAVDVEGPGEVHSFMNGAFGDVINHYIDSSDGGPDVIPVSRNAHVHTNWSFSEPGDYEFEVTPSATTTSGDELTGPTASYHIRVGESTPTDELGLEVTSDKPDATYLYGQGITLTAAPTEATELDHYHWFIKRDGAPDYVISNLSSSAELKLPTSLVWDGAQVYASLYDDDHNVVASSEPLELHVSALPEVTDLTAEADQSSYDVGDVAHFTSAQDPATGEEHFHWYQRLPGEEFYTYIPDSNQGTLDLPITAQLDGAEVVVRLFDHDHAVIGESDPIALSVGDQAAPAETTLTIAASPAKQVYGTKKPATIRVRVTDETGAPGAGTVDIKVAKRLVGDDVALDDTGLAAVKVPASFPVGAHALSATFTPADPAAQAAGSLKSGVFKSAKAPTAIKIGLPKKKIRKQQRAALNIRVTLPQSKGVSAAGKANVYDGSKRIAVAKVGKGGKGSVKLPRLKPGTHKIKVVYPATSTRAKATSKVLVLKVMKR